MQEPAQVSDAPPEVKEVDIVDVAGDPEKARLPFTKSFTITWRNPETGVVKVGTFTATRPNVGAIGQIAVFKAKLNGGMAIDPMADFTHMMRADLHYILTDVPDWWRPADFFTATPLREVWDHVVSWLHTFRPASAG